MLTDFVQFVEMGKMEYQPSNWISPLIRLALLSTEKDFFKEYDRLDSKVADMLMHNYKKADIVKEFLQFRSEFHNNILSLRSITVGSRTELILVVHYLVREVVVESATETDKLDLLHTGMLNSLYFHRLYLNTYLTLLRSDPKLQEDIVESTQISAYSIFTGMDTWDLDEHTPAFVIKHTDKVSLSAMFTHYHSSYYVILEESRSKGDAGFLNATLSSAYYLGIAKTAPEDSDEKEKGSEFAMWLQDFLMKVLTMCKIFRQFNFGVNFQMVAEKIRETAVSLDMDEFLWLPYKADYWLADKLYSELLSGQQLQILDTANELESAIDSLEFKIANIKQDEDTEPQ